MENQDKLFEQLKETAQEAESKEFPAIEKVWSRVEEKLDHKKTARLAGLWKKLAVAATLLLLLTLGYQIFNERPPAPKPQIVVTPPNSSNNVEVAETPPSPVESDPIKTDPINKRPRTNPLSVKTRGVTLANRELPSAAPKINIPAAAAQTSQTYRITGTVSDDTGFLPGANVVVMGTTRGTQTDTDGRYSIDVKKGEQILFSFNGLNDAVATVGEKNTMNMRLEDEQKRDPNKNFKAGREPKSKNRQTEARRNKKYAPAKTLITPENPDETPNIDFRSNSPTLYIIDGVPSTENQFKQIKTDEIASMKLMTKSEATSVYGKKAVNGAFIISRKTAKSNADSYPENEPFTENGFESPVTTPLSTFSVDVDNSAYTNIRRYISDNKEVPREEVKIEAMINSFGYRYPQPQGAHPFTINTEYSSCPWNSRHKLLKIGLRGKDSGQSIAKDVRIQIEFNPMHVQSYRLIGYENRKPRAEDYSKDAQNLRELTGGHTVTALYEVIPFGVENRYFSESPGLKYTKIETGTTFVNELATIKFRYTKPDGDKSIEMVKTVDNKPALLNDSSKDFRFCAAVAWFGLRLRDSRLIGNKSYDDLIKLAKGSLSNDDDGKKAEFIRLIEAQKANSK